jgi:PHD/YefM family antitoxin component YafN of YafNO toxin-antitoxin module
MKQPTQFLTNEKGEKVALVISIEEYKKLLEELEELDDIRAYDEAKVVVILEVGHRREIYR